MNYKETDDIWRLYRREWVTVHTMSTAMTGEDSDGPRLLETAHTWVRDNLHGRVRDNDVDYEANTDNNTMIWIHVKVFKDTLKGEFKYVENAQSFASIEGYDEYTIVPRNSKSDHDIRNYGVVKL